MKNTIKVLGIIAIVAVIGFSLVACKEDEPTEKEEAVSLPSTTAEFTFTDIPAKYNGKFALLNGEDKDAGGVKIIWGFNGGTKKGGEFSTVTGIKIENGSVKIPLYICNMFGQAKSLSAYTGSAASIVITIFENDVVSPLRSDMEKNSIGKAQFFNYSDEYPVKFTNGKATKSNNNADVKLTN